MKTKRKGFTLIELLVVVAIIGILATVVLASLGKAREKAKIAAAKSTMKAFQTNMEIAYLDSETGYFQKGTREDCLQEVFNSDFRKEIYKNIRGLSNNIGVSCYAEPESYAVYFWIAGRFAFCADSSGFFGESRGIRTNSVDFGDIKVCLEK